MTIKPIVTYIETYDGFVPTRPAPLIMRSCTDPLSNLWKVSIVDQHGNEHLFLHDCTKDDAELYTHALAAVALALSKQELITIDYLDQIIEINAAEKAKEAKR